MSSNRILQGYKESLHAYNNRHVIVSAATPLELSKRDGIRNSAYAIKQGNSSTESYYEDNRAEYETPIMDITVFVKTGDTHTNRDHNYELMNDMADEVRGWVKKLDNADISTDIYYTKYIGVINTIDDQPGFYSQTIRVEYNTKQQIQ